MAGTLVLTAAGLVVIECVKAGDKVISTDPDTMERAEKTVLETYVRETNEVVHLTINGEVITSTLDHPFYVQDAGFVGAGELYIRDKLLDAEGNTLLVEDMRRETLAEPVKVYNFQVEDFHTYLVGFCGVLVHNAGDTYSRPSRHRKGVRDEVFDSAKGDDGIVRDPLTQKPISPDEPWDMGHKPGYEFRKHQKSARERGISRKQFLDEHNNPKHYRPELPASNRSGLAEDVTDLYLGP